MATDWAADVKKHVPNADDDAIAGIIRHCGIALQSQDASLVSFGDDNEVDRVKQSFLAKKLGITDADQQEAAIKAVGEKLKGASRKTRPTVYYMLADHFNKLDLFKKQ